ncbi:hypothetical protein BDV25DRAFT_152371 [Aspergillus avenaceus]|uniref:Uncharacterized protein n=1 Tax=Aspergillus avenaceus TaxID=36643 RepID=A0A5N6TZ29_ASPAV|nr:hypothetical protein BDV25DRAFT_152371 [Aspergillus avenaceus]
MLSSLPSSWVATIGLPLALRRMRGRCHVTMIPPFTVILKTKELFTNNSHSAGSTDSTVGKKRKIIWKQVRRKEGGRKAPTYAIAYDLIPRQRERGRSGGGTREIRF